MPSVGTRAPAVQTFPFPGQATAEPPPGYGSERHAAVRTVTSSMLAHASVLSPNASITYVDGPGTQAPPSLRHGPAGSFRPGALFATTGGIRSGAPLRPAC